VITREQYCMGRAEGYVTAEINANIDATLLAWNGLLEDMAADGVYPGVDQVTGTAVASGLRPPGVNARTQNAATDSTHLTGEGGDVQDQAERDIMRWCLRNLAKVAARGLYLEHPQWTSRRDPKTGKRDPWVHGQTRRPLSGLRVYRPSMAPPSAPPLPEQAENGVIVCDYVPQEGEDAATDESSAVA
jgi:hypothetical protein